VYVVRTVETYVQVADHVNRLRQRGYSVQNVGVMM